MKEWFLSTDLVGLEGMPNKVGSISVRAKRENWESRKAKTGGRSLEYHISSFDDDIVQQLKKKSSSDEATIALYHENENPHEKKKELVNYQQAPQLNHIYNFLGKFIDCPVETIKKLDLDDKLTSKLDEKLFDIELEQQQLKEYKEKENWAASFEGMNIGKKITNDSRVKLDYYDIDVSAGHATLIIQENQSDCITFNRQFINNEIGVNANNAFLMPVKGDSMYPTLKNQAIIMVSKVDEFSSDGIYVFRFYGKIMVKRLQFTKTGLNVISDNTTYEAWQLTSDELSTEEFEFIGEVVWSGQGM